MPDSVQPTATMLKIPLRRKLSLVWSYATERLQRQIRAVAFITAYLALFQIFVLRAPIADFLQIALGILSVVAGLAFFMEGLFLAIMPLGERCGLRCGGRIEWQSGDRGTAFHIHLPAVSGAPDGA